MARKTQTLAVQGRQISVSNLDKVLYAAGPYSKGDVIDYYIRISKYLLPHVKDRPVTLKRYPDGALGEFFYEKDAPSFTPEWVQTFPVPRRTASGNIRYILINDLPTLVWLANLANLEIHPFLHRVPHLDRPTSVVFDLDPGEGADVLSCGRVALLMRDVLSDLGLKCLVKASGSKGLQLYVPLNTAVTYSVVEPFAKSLAMLLEERHSDLVVSDMAKTKRRNKVFIDWSQNSDFKTTIGVYSLRAKTAVPYVSVPLEWDELEAAVKAGDAKRLFFTPGVTLERVEKLGDIFKPLLTLKQKLPAGIEAPPSLAKYRAKRDFTKTAEPAPEPVRRSKQGSRRRFVVQKHAASHLHYDFRLEMHDVLKSWAVPKGPPYAKEERRLAMPTEDHPMDYLDFEGVIPAGQYGGGTVMVWDIGTYELIEGNYYKGFLHFSLSGSKLKGEWILVRGGDKWFMVKTNRSMRPISKKLDDTSALSSRSMEEIRSARDATWHSNRNQPDLSELPAATMEFIAPMLAKPTGKIPQGEKWQYEVKLDGYRALAFKNKSIKLVSRRGNELNRKYPEIAAALKSLPDGTIVDGEIVAMTADGKPSFSLLQNAAGRRGGLYYYIFDLLAYRGKDVRGFPLSERRKILEEHALAAASDPIRLSNIFDVSADDLIRVARQTGLEGIIAKRADSRYEAGERTGSWVKFKTNQSQELVIAGYKPGKDYFDYLLAGYYDSNGQLMFAGKIKNGFVAATRREVANKFKPVETSTCPFANLPEPANARRGEAITTEVMKRCRWLKPEIVAQIEITEWTSGNHLRHAKFAGLRDDKEPTEVVRETTAE